MSFVLLIEFFFLKEKNFFRLGLFSRSYECFMDYSQRTLYIVLQCFAVLELLLHIGKFFHLLWICQHVFMGFRMSIHFQNMILFRNVFSFSKCERCHECFFFSFSYYSQRTSTAVFCWSVMDLPICIHVGAVKKL